MLHLVNKPSLPYDNISLLKQHSYHLNKSEWWGTEYCRLELDKMRQEVKESDFKKCVQICFIYEAKSLW